MRKVATAKGFRSAALLTCLTVGLVVLLLPVMAGAQTFVQKADNAPAPGTATTASATFAGAQTAGDLNVVIIGCSDNSSSVTGVSDTAGNTYLPAIGTTGGSGVSQMIWYAKGIKAAAANTNTVTATFNASAAFPDLFALEYSGVDTTAPLNITAGKGGSGASASSGSATTTVANAVIVAGGSTTGGFTNSNPPANFTIRDRTSPDGNIAGDNIVSSAGSYSVSDTTSAGWVMQLAAFGTTPTVTGAVTVTSITPNSGGNNGGDVVTIGGTGFAPGAMAFFGVGSPFSGISLVNCAVQSSTSIQCTTPVSPTAGAKDVIVMNVDGQSGFGTGATGWTYFAVTPTISSITPDTDITNGGNGGSQVTISGNNFTSGTAVGVFFDTIPADNVAFTNNTTVKAAPPAHAAGNANVTVKTSNGPSAPFGFTYTKGNGPINFVQFGDFSESTKTLATASVTMPNAQVAGDLNVVIAGWGDTSASVSGITDTAGNTYTQAIPATNFTGHSLSQTIWYAKNINASGSNTITVAFAPSASTPDVRVLEYSGLDATAPLDPNPLSANASTGTTGPADSGPITTTFANNVIVSGAMVNQTVLNAGPGFETVDVTTNGNNAEHAVNSSAVNAVHATANIVNGAWLMQAVTFHGAGGGTTPDFGVSATALSPATIGTSASATSTVSVAGTNGFASAVALTCAVTPATGGVTCAASPASVTPGGAPATSTLTVTSASATPGNYTINVTGTSGGLKHSLASPLALTVQSGGGGAVTIAPFTFSPASIAAGGSTSATVTVTGASSAVTLTCAVTPAVTPAPTCSLNPSSTSTTSTVTVGTTAPTAALAPRATGILYALLLPIGGMTLLGAGFTSRRKKLLGIVLLCMVIAGFVFMTACGGGSSSSGGGGHNPGTPAGTYTVTVSASGTNASGTGTFTVQ